MLVTGATDGIGEEVARGLAARGARVLVHGRSTARAEEAGARIGGRREPVVGDLSTLAGARALVEDVRGRTNAVDGLLNNAGIGFGTAPRRTDRTSDGHEPTWQVNVLAVHVITLGLKAELVAGHARVVNVSSGLHQSAQVDLEQPDDPRHSDPYRQSKVADVMLAFEIAERWADDGVSANACEPGWIATKMGGRGASGTLAEGADTPLWLLTDPELDGVTGRYFARRAEVDATAQARDPQARRALWDLVERQVAG